MKKFIIINDLTVKDFNLVIIFSKFQRLSYNRISFRAYYQILFEFSRFVNSIASELLSKFTEYYLLYASMCIITRWKLCLYQYQVPFPLVQACWLEEGFCYVQTMQPFANANFPRDLCDTEYTFFQKFEKQICAQLLFFSITPRHFAKYWIQDLR